MTSQARATLRSDARDNRTRILTVARAAFAAEGIDVSLREIARRAEVGIATLYRHFPTKDALLAEAFADQMASCAEIVHEGLAAADPWAGFSLVIEKLMFVHALDRGFARAYTSQLVETPGISVRQMLVLIHRAKEARALRGDFVIEDVSLALMANEGIRAASPELRVAASRRLAAMMLASFRARADAPPLPPAVRLPLTAR